MHLPVNPHTSDLHASANDDAHDYGRPRQPLPLNPQPLTCMSYPTFPNPRPPEPPTRTAHPNRTPPRLSGP